MIPGRNDSFYYSPSLKGLPSVLFALDKVGHGPIQSISRLFSEPLLDFSKLTGKDSNLLIHSYHTFLSRRCCDCSRSSTENVFVNRFKKFFLLHII